MALNGHGYRMAIHAILLEPVVLHVLNAEKMGLFCMFAVVFSSVAATI